MSKQPYKKVVLKKAIGAKIEIGAEKEVRKVYRDGNHVFIFWRSNNIVMVCFCIRAQNSISS